MSHNLPNFFYQMLCSTEKTAIALTSNVSLAAKFQQSHLHFFIKTDVIAKLHSCKKREIGHTILFGINRWLKSLRAIKGLKEYSFRPTP